MKTEKNRDNFRLDISDVNVALLIKDARGNIVYDNGKLSPGRASIRPVFSTGEGLTVYVGESPLENRISAVYDIDDIIGCSEKIVNVKRLLNIAAKNDAPVVITGESGTGKELAAQAIHHQSGRMKGPFIAVNCGSIPGDLVESELFGYAPNAFTGASSKGYSGKFRSADGGTIFLDEIGDMPHSTQVKLLRFLQDGIVQPVGSLESFQVDVKVIAATNKDLNHAIKIGIFREDLYYRLNVFNIQMPSLRERPEDIRLLIEYFEISFRKKYSLTDPVTFDENSQHKLKHYKWPGNVRELQNFVDRELWMNNGEKKVISHIPDYILNSIVTEQTVSGVGKLEKTEVLFLAECLEQAAGNISVAARLAGISRSTYYRKISKYGFGK